MSFFVRSDRMNEKSRRFEEFLVKEDIQCFEKREMEDEDHTVV